MLIRVTGINWTLLLCLVPLTLLFGYWSTERKQLALDKRTLFKIWIIDSTHFFLCSLQTFAWLPLMPQRYDWIFMAVHLGRLISYFWSECVLNYTTKKLIDPTYVRNSRPYDEPYIEGLPKVLRYAYIAAVLLVAPFVMFVVFATPENYPRLLRPYALHIAIGVTAWAYYGYVNFARSKFV